MYHAPLIDPGTELRTVVQTERFRIRPMTVQDVIRDYEAVASSPELLGARRSATPTAVPTPYTFEHGTALELRRDADDHDETGDGVSIPCDDGSVVTVTPMGGLFGHASAGSICPARSTPRSRRCSTRPSSRGTSSASRARCSRPTDELRIIQYFDDGVYYEPDVVAYQVPGYPQIQIVSNIELEGKPIGYANRRGMEWRSDLSGMPVLPKASMMYAIEVPELGGETYFANGHLAYETLPPARRAELDGLDATYSWVTLQRWLAAASGTWEPHDDEAARRHPDVVRPLVRVHPVTGRKALFFSVEEITSLTDLDSAETQRAAGGTDRAHDVDAARVYRHDWSVGDVLVWDNRCLMHSVCEYNYEGQRRLMHQLNGADARSAEQTVAVIPVSV